MSRNKIILQWVASIVIICFLLPLVKIGSTTSVKPDWFVVNLLTLFTLIYFSRIMQNKLFRKYAILFVFIAIFSLVSNYISGSYYLTESQFRLPMTILQIFNRIVVFIFFAYSISEKWVSFQTMKRVINIVFISSLIFGFLQFFNFLGARDFALEYFLEEGSVQEMNFSTFNRIIGISPAIITWGGCSIMMFHYFYFIVTNKFLKYLGVLLSVFNVFAAASRAAIISLFVSYILILLIKVLIVDKRLSSFFKVSLTSIVFFVFCFLMLKTYVPEQIDFIEKRFESSEDAMTTEGRGAQISYFVGMLEADYFGVIFGVGDSVIAQYGYLEVDYAYVFVSFGIVGFILHYLLIFYLLREAFRLRKLDTNCFLFIFGSTIGYLIFSFGFYFLYELYMGMPFWWLNGLVIGYLWMLNKNNNGAEGNKSFSAN